MRSLLSLLAARSVHDARRLPRPVSLARVRIPLMRSFACLLFALSLTACTMHTETETQSFDSATWKSQRGVAGADNRRGPLVQALAQVIRTGMTRDDVLGVLGPPDSTRAASTDVYELGRMPYGIDEEYYEIRYRDGRVESHGMGRR